MLSVQRTWSRSGAKPARRNGSRRTRTFDRAIAERFGALHAEAAAGQHERLGRDAGRRAGAAPPARPVLAQHVPRLARRPLRRTRRRARSRARRSRRASTRQVAPELRQLLLPAVHAFRSRSPTRSAASRSATHCAATSGSPMRATTSEIIRRFGRFPHRNAILGRHTTPGRAGLPRWRRICRLSRS